MSEPEEARGLAAWVRAHRVGVTAGAVSAAFVLVAAGVFAVGFATAEAAPVAAPSRSPSASATPDPRPVPGAIPGPARLRTCSVATAAADPRLGTLQGQVRNASTGEVLWDRGGSAAVATGSLVKVLTAASALAVLGPDYRIPTDTVDLGDGGVAIVGHGDATLSRTPAGSEGWYDGAPKLSDLAAQTVTAWAAKHPGEQITSLTLDASYWSDADAWDPTWPDTERTLGYQSAVTALQVDGDRDDPFVDQSPRSSDPVGRAGALFAQALHDADTGGVVAGDLEVTRGTAPSTAAKLGEVQSQPVGTLIPQMLIRSDNTLGEMLARITSIQAGADGSAASIQAVDLKALAAYEVATDGIAVRDGSGESDRDAVPAQYLTQLMIRIQGGAQHLDIIRDGLPVAGQPGSLESRFTGANAKARGKVTAKTGWLKNVYALSGIVAARDGSTLTFQFTATADGIGDTPDGKAALDTLTTAVYSCGDNLANT